MLGEGTPRSTTRSPVLEAMIGPMVVPHGQSFLTWLGVGLGLGLGLGLWLGLGLGLG